MFSFVGDVVLDSFLGAGTTTAAAIKAGRSSVGYEIEPGYIELIKRRLMQVRFGQEFEVEYLVDEESLGFAAALCSPALPA